MILNPEFQLFVYLLILLFYFKGIKRLSKSIWKSFKVEFKGIEESLIAAKDEITEEVQLASEQEAHGFRRLLTSEVEENKMFRLKHMADMQENKEFRVQQSLALSQTQTWQVQKIVKEAGNLSYSDERESCLTAFVLQSARKSGYYKRSRTTTTLSVSARRRHDVTKGLATGLSVNRNSKIGSHKGIQTISGATAYVCQSFINLGNTILHTMLTFVRLKLVVEKLYSRMCSTIREERPQICCLNNGLGDTLLIICQKPSR